MYFGCRRGKKNAVDPRTQGEVLVVDGDSALRRHLVALLAGDGLSTHDVGTAEQALVIARAKRPRLVLLEIRLPGMCGYELLRRLRELWGELMPIVFMSGERTESFDRVAGMLLGADDYLIKPFAADELLARIRRLIRTSDSRNSAPKRALTTREQEVLELLAAGKGQREIASALVISPKTCAKHIERILEKLDVHSRAQAVAVAYRDDLLAARH